MKIEVNRTIDVPDKLICHSGRSNCPALNEIPDVNEDFRMCANFNSVVKWSNTAGFFVRCPQCIEAQVNYLRQK